jgi:copper chaperone CopZ
MKFIPIALVLFFATQAHAEFTWVEVGVEGLTCSQCARSVELKVRKLDFVEDVKMNLRTTTMRVELKRDSGVDIIQIAKAVDDAGFSVGYVNAGFVFHQVEVEDGLCLRLNDVVFNFVKTGHRVLDGETILKFVGQPFLSGREFAEWKPSLPEPCDESDEETCFVTVL